MNISKLSIGTLLSTLLLFTACNTQPGSTPEADLSTKLDSVSYALGYQGGSMMAREGLTDLSTDNYNAGLQTGLNSDESLLTQAELRQVTSSYFQELAAQQGQENLEEGQAFLEENKEKEGVMVTESGLQYKVIEEGDGASPTAENIVRVHYEGSLINGDTFDSSYQRGQPAEFPLGRVIQGWTEGLQLMQEGATYEFYIPGNLAYASRPPQGSPIGMNETLIFKVELLEVKPGQ